MEKKNTSWGNVSDWYDATVEGADSYQQKVIMPNLMRIVAPEKGVKILDVGCGTGVFARAVSEVGAKVTGVDLGKELIDIAREKSKVIEYVVASADNLSVIKDGEYDIAIIVLAIQNMKNLDNVIEEVSKKIKSGGRFVMVLNHPDRKSTRLNSSH